MTNDEARRKSECQNPKGPQFDVRIWGPDRGRNVGPTPGVQPGDSWIRMSPWERETLRHPSDKCVRRPNSGRRRRFAAPTNPMLVEPSATSAGFPLSHRELILTHKSRRWTPSVWQPSYGLRIPANPKSETLNPKQSPKTRILMGPNCSMPPRNCGRTVVLGLGYSDLGLVSTFARRATGDRSDFDIRNSDFPRSPTMSGREVVGHVQLPWGEGKGEGNKGACMTTHVRLGEGQCQRTRREAELANRTTTRVNLDPNLCR
jgi:hypothetical protein